MTHDITPPDLVISCFGGVRRTARALECDPATVSRWRKSGRIPAGYQKQILQAAWEHGHDLTAHDLIFGRATTDILHT